MTDFASYSIRKPLITLDEAKFLLLGLNLYSDLVDSCNEKYNFFTVLRPFYTRDYKPNRLTIQTKDDIISEVIKFG